MLTTKHKARPVIGTMSHACDHKRTIQYRIIFAAACLSAMLLSGCGGAGSGSGGSPNNQQPPTQPTPGPVYVGTQLSPGFNMGVSSSGGLSNWVTNENGFMQCAYPTGQQWGSVFITAGPPTSDTGSRLTVNESQFNYLSVDLKGANGGETVAVGVKTNTDPNNGDEPVFTVSNLTTNWQTFKIPLSSLVAAPAYPATRFTQLYVVCELVFEPGVPSETVSFRNVEFTN
jgi:hypothetical protein